MPKQPRDILRDARGINTEATVRNTLALRPRRVLAVSHFYHLPRIKMSAWVPVKDSCTQ